MLQGGLGGLWGFLAVLAKMAYFGHFSKNSQKRIFRKSLEKVPTRDFFGTFRKTSLFSKNGAAFREIPLVFSKNAWMKDSFHLFKKW